MNVSTQMTPVFSVGSTQERITVVYHDNCADGIASAMIVTAAVAAHVGKELYHVPAVYGKPLPIEKDHPRFGTLYFVDFCPSIEQLQQIEAWHYHKVVILDHHASAFENIGDWSTRLKAMATQHPSLNVQLFLSMNESGASMTYKYFEQALTDIGIDEKYHQLARLVRTYDLWEHGGDNRSTAAETATGLVCFYKRALKDWGMTISHVFTSVTNRLLDSISELGREEIQRVEQEARGLRESQSETGKFWCGIGKHSRVVVKIGWYVDVLPELINEVANQAEDDVYLTVMARKVYQEALGIKSIKLSFRCKSPAAFGMHMLAKEVAEGGGGHAASAACTLVGMDSYEEAQDIVRKAIIRLSEKV